MHLTISVIIYNTSLVIRIPFCCFVIPANFVVICCYSSDSSFSPQTVGVIVRLEKETFQVLNMHNKVRSKVKSYFSIH